MQSKHKGKHVVTCPLCRKNLGNVEVQYAYINRTGNAFGSSYRDSFVGTAPVKICKAHQVIKRNKED